MDEANGNGDGFSKTELFAVAKKEGVSIVVTLLEKDGKHYVDLRERVDSPKEGWDGWTRRGLTVPSDVFAEIVAKAAVALEPVGEAGK